jgi:hypothetical protein
MNSPKRDQTKIRARWGVIQSIRWRGMRRKRLLSPDLHLLLREMNRWRGYIGRDIGGGIDGLMG